ncbi:unnamed protein product [Rhizopus stolonifer]
MLWSRDTAFKDFVLFKIYLLSFQDTYELNNDVRTPAFGLGTLQSKSQEVYQAALTALKAGYKHIDIAAVYRNEKEVTFPVKRSLLLLKYNEKNGRNGKVRAVGVIYIYCQSVKLYLYLSQPDLILFCQKHNIHVTAYSPFGSTHSSVMQEPLVLSLGYSTWMFNYSKISDIFPYYPQFPSYPIIFRGL